MNLEKKLPSWIENGYNVMFRGRHGVGKTAMIKEAFEKAGLKWMYFSASTMDPWVDFIGVPKEMKTADGKSYLELVRPKVFQDDEIEALFFDEFNRSPKKVRNAVMELIQFKSINGKKFNKLKMIWAAINPEDDDEKYDVEELDPAQIDRFQVIVDIPYAPHLPFFKNKYGEDHGEVAVNWWKELAADGKKLISPRRLDYALDHYKRNGDLRDVLPAKANINKLVQELSSGSITKNLKRLWQAKDESESKKFLSIENNFIASQELIVKNADYLTFFLPLMLDEKISSLISSNDKVFSHALKNFDQFKSILKEIMDANLLPKDKIRKIRGEFSVRETKDLLSPVSGAANVKRHFEKSAKPDEFSKRMDFLNEPPTMTTQDRLKNYQTLEMHLPPTMTSQDGQKAIRLVSDILVHSHQATINASYKRLIPMLNHIVIVLKANNIVPLIDTQAASRLVLYPDYIGNLQPTP